MLGPAAAGAAPAPADGLVRVLHLSPDTPSMDAYVDPVAGAAAAAVLPAVGYGDVSGYERVPAGTYTLAIRAAGADPAGPPALGTTLVVAPGSATTVAAVGLFADLRLTALPDDLSLPAAGQSRVRVVHGAATADVLDAALRDGLPLASRLGFAGSSGYVDVPAGPARLTVTAGPALAGRPVDVPVELPAGSIHTVLVLDREGGGLEVRTALDAAGVGVVPRGGVEAGAGGTAPPDDDGGARAAAAAAAGSGLALLGTILLRRRDRGRAPRHAAS